MANRHDVKTLEHMPSPINPQPVRIIRKIAVAVIIISATFFAAAIIGLAVDKAAFDAEKYEVYINGY
jgi:hypothetical protein